MNYKYDFTYGGNGWNHLKRKGPWSVVSESEEKIFTDLKQALLEYVQIQSDKSFWDHSHGTMEMIEMIFITPMQQNPF